MRTAIITSEENIASANIRGALLRKYSWRNTCKHHGEPVLVLDKDHKIRLYLINGPIINHEDIDKDIDADLFIFPCTHTSASKIPSFSVHAPGNWGKAMLGGKDKQLGVSSPFMMKRMLKKLKALSEKHNQTYDVVQEATHHGPYIEKPSIFTEIGSTEKEWSQEINGEIVAEAIIGSLLEDKEKETPPKEISSVGIGGTHTCANFNKIMFDSIFAIGHVCPKYNLENLDDNMLEQALKRSSVNAQVIIVDYKGLGKEKARIKELLNKKGIEWKKTRDIQKDKERNKK